jgi:hypothetical protein
MCANYYLSRRPVSKNLQNIHFTCMFGGQFGVCQKGWEDGLLANHFDGFFLS